MQTYNLLAELEAVLNPHSLYAKQIKYNIDEFIELVVEELKQYFNLDQQEIFKGLIKKELVKIS